MIVVDNELAQRRQQLEALRDELLELIALSRSDRSTVELDQQSVGRLSRMDALQRQAMAQAQQRTREAELVRIDQALQRLEEGEYGYCVNCGEEIAAARLDVDLAATHCINCAK